MRHPSGYAAVPFNGMHIMVVDAGTSIKDERTGETIVVDDTTAAAKGALVYCTQKIFDALKAKTSSEERSDTASPRAEHSPDTNPSSPRQIEDEGSEDLVQTLPQQVETPSGHRLAEIVAAALVDNRNKKLPVPDAPMDWDHISSVPGNEWYDYYMGQAYTALEAMAPAIREACAVAAWSEGMRLSGRVFDAREVGASAAKAIRKLGAAVTEPLPQEKFEPIQTHAVVTARSSEL